MSLVPNFLRFRGGSTVTELSTRLRNFLESKGLPVLGIEDQIKLVLDLGGLDDSFFSDAPRRFIGYADAAGVPAQLAGNEFHGKAQRTIVDFAILSTDGTDIVTCHSNRLTIGGVRPCLIANMDHKLGTGFAKASIVNANAVGNPGVASQFMAVRVAAQATLVQLNWRLGPPLPPTEDCIGFWNTTVNTPLRVTFFGRESDTAPSN